MIVYQLCDDTGSSWWRHQMETFSALLAICTGNSPASGEFPTQRPVTRSFDVSFDLCINKWLRKQSWGWWFETLSRPLWRHCNVKSFFMEDRESCIPRSLSLLMIVWLRESQGTTTDGIELFPMEYSGPSIPEELVIRKNILHDTCSVASISKHGGLLVWILKLSSSHSKQSKCNNDINIIIIWITNAHGKNIM